MDRYLALIQLNNNLAGHRMMSAAPPLEVVVFYLLTSSQRLNCFHLTSPIQIRPINIINIVPSDQHTISWTQQNRHQQIMIWILLLQSVDTYYILVLIKATPIARISQHSN